MDPPSVRMADDVAVAGGCACRYAKDLRISVSESFIRSLSRMRLEVHRKFPKTESLKVRRGAHARTHAQQGEG